MWSSYKARLAQLIRRRRAAKKLGISYSRGKYFVMPSRVVGGGKEFPLVVPDEQGVKVAFADIFLDDCYGLDRYFASKKFQTVLDIGANVGLFSTAARMHYPNAIIHAYEPNPQLEHYLRSQEVRGSFMVHMEAVGEKCGSVYLSRADDSVLSRTNRSEGIANIRQVAFSTAIERLTGKVDLVKMDCEGAEWDIFKEPTAWENVGAVSMEYHLFDDHDHRDAGREVRRLGFSVLEHVPMDGCGIIIASRTE